MAASTTLVLPEELTIYTVADLRTQWLGWIADLHEDATIDGAGVGQVDAAGVQLLASLARSLDARQLGWRLQGAGDALRDACRTLGLAERLAVEPEPCSAG